MENGGRVNYAVIDAFTSEPFKGNPAAVCLLEGEATARNASDDWMKSVAAEFNLSETCFLVPLILPSENSDAVVPRFHLRWFTPVAEVNLCGHATLASAHFLFTSVCEKYNEVEFITKSGILTAKKGFDVKLSASKGNAFSIELNFPLIPFVDDDFSATSLIPETLNGAIVVDIKKTTGDLHIVVVESGLDVVKLEQKADEIRKCPGLGVIVTGPTPEGSQFDFFSRFFAPKLGVDEDPVCGSAHCSLAPYWAGKLGKDKFMAYMASPRGGVLDLAIEEETQRLKIRGEAVTVMTGTLLC